MISGDPWLRERERETETDQDVKEEYKIDQWFDFVNLIHNRGILVILPFFFFSTLDFVFFTLLLFVFILFLCMYEMT